VGRQKLAIAMHHHNFQLTLPAALMSIFHTWKV
jgi:hypothetical protein